MKVTDQLAALHRLKIHNPHNLLSRFGDREHDVCVSYAPASTRMAGASGARVFSPFFDAAPDAPWYDYKQKKFVGRMAEALPKAKAWAEEQYGATEWVNFPGSRNSYVPKRVLDRALAAAAKEVTHA